VAHSDVLGKINNKNKKVLAWSLLLEKKDANLIIFFSWPNSSYMNLNYQ
jgi:hypothetical protein